MLLKTMRRVVRLRELGEPAAHLLAHDIDACKQRWSWVPPTPEGMTISWPADVSALAAELGFDPDCRAAEDIDLRSDGRLGGARPPYRRSIDPVVPPSLEQARHLRDCIERGDLMIGILPLSAIDEMVACYRALGAAGNLEAWRELGECYAHGTGVRRSLGDARSCWLLGAEGGDRECALAIIRGELDAPRGDGKLAQSLVAPLLSEDRDGRAHVLAGYMAFRGFGEPMDVTRSADLHRRAAAMGNADAMFELSLLASTGRGMPRDNDAALRWCVQAAELGHPRACYNLGAFYAKGRGVPQDWAAAVRWYTRAAELGNPRAAATLATMYERGEGVEVDLALAAYYGT